MRRIPVVLSLLVIFSACNNSQPDTSTTTASDATPPLINFSVANIFPHDTTSYTEGLLLVHQGQIFESTGHTDGFPSSRSLFGVWDPKTGKIQVKAEIGNKYFGEGISFLNGKLYQLTLDSKVGFIYDDKTFKKTGEFYFPSVQGWGMTTDSVHLIMSDGTSNLSFLDPQTFKLAKVLGVSDNNGPVGNLNELEWINGYVYANQWQTNYILKIDPGSGKVLGRMDLGSLVNEVKNKYPEADVLNGIAYDPSNGKVYVTGKMWPNLYEIKFGF